MKKRKVFLSLAVAVALVFNFPCMSKASCGDIHDWVRGDAGITLVRLYTHSHYKEKNGRLDYWPCIVYDKRQNYKVYCIECGYIDHSLDSWISIGTVHQDAY